MTNASFKFNARDVLAKVFSKDISDSKKNNVADILTRLTGGRPSESSISDEGNDTCVRCRQDTGVPALLPVDRRKNYVEGVGQYCSRCY